jgi:hypothetical protein
MSKIWPHEMIRELLALAEAGGEARAELETRREAERFRFAIYSFRRQNNIGNSLSVTIDGNTVVVARKEMPTVTILSDDNAGAA